MRSMSLLQMAGGVAVAGVVAVGGTALTGSGVTWLGTGTAKTTQFVGGTVSQSVTGAQVTGVAYAFSDGTDTIVSGVTITFHAGDVTGTNAVTLAPSGTGYTGNGAEWTCGTAGDSTSCTVKTSGHVAVTGAANGYDGLTALAITVA
jgi:hypothetical protein